MKGAYLCFSAEGFIVSSSTAAAITVEEYNGLSDDVHEGLHVPVSERLLTEISSGDFTIDNLKVHALDEFSR